MPAAKFRLRPAGLRALETALAEGKIDDRTFQLKTIFSLEGEGLLRKLPGTVIHRRVETAERTHLDFKHFYEITEAGKALLGSRTT